MATRLHTVTRASRAKAPISLRVRMRMGAFLIGHLQSPGPDYMVRAISRKDVAPKPCRSIGSRPDMMDASETHAPALRLWLLAVAAMIFLTLDRRRGHAAHRIRPVDHPVEAGHRRGAAAVASRLAAGIQGLPGDPAIQGAQPRDDARPVQGDLLVRMDAPAARAHHRHGVSAAAVVFSVARLGAQAPARRGCGPSSAPAPRSARSAGGWCRRGWPAPDASACRSIASRSI